jgi:hypothetical protein
VDEVEEVIRPLKEFGPPEVDLVQPMPYTVVQRLIDPVNPPGRRNYWKAENMNHLPNEAIDALVEQAAVMTSPVSVVLLESKGDDKPVGGRRNRHRG